APHAQTASAQMALKITCIQRARLENHRRLFVRRSAVAPRHGSVEHPQVDSQLCAMMRGVGDKRGAEDLRARGVDEHPVAESQPPWRIRLLPRHLLENLQELTAQFLKEPYALFTRR